MLRKGKVEKGGGLAYMARVAVAALLVACRGLGPAAGRGRGRGGFCRVSRRERL